MRFVILCQSVETATAVQSPIFRPGRGPMPIAIREQEAVAVPADENLDNRFPQAPFSLKCVCLALDVQADGLMTVFRRPHEGLGDCIEEFDFRRPYGGDELFHRTQINVHRTSLGKDHSPGLADACTFR